MTKSAREIFEEQNLNSLWDRVRFWFFIRRLYWLRKIDIWEGYLDKLYFETKLKEQLTYKDGEDRKALEQEYKRDPSERDPEKIEEIENRISFAKAIKEQYRKNQELMDSNMKYKELLDLWCGKSRMDSTLTADDSNRNESTT